MGSSYIRINKQTDFPEFTTAHKNKKVVIYLRYSISNGAGSTSGNWVATSYTDPSLTSSNYRLIVFKFFLKM